MHGPNKELQDWMLGRSYNINVYPLAEWEKFSL